MTEKEIVQKYLDKIEEVHRGSDNRITHAWVEGEARANLEADIRHLVTREQNRCILIAEEVANSMCDMDGKAREVSEEIIHRIKNPKA